LLAVPITFDDGCL